MHAYLNGKGGTCTPSARLVACLIIVALIFSPYPVSAVADDDIMEMSLQDLLDVDVTSVSKKAEKLSEAAAAVYVISNEDIRRSTAKTIPDLLRTVPGVNVAQLDAHTWSVTVRGQGGEYATKLLVLVDGRSVYTPFFSGVFWDTIDLVLEDVDRIEIVRGPGGTVWGANAVNGVINIVTKSAEDTQGGLVSAAAGNTIDGSLSLRHGGTIGEDHFYRMYAKGVQYDESGTDFLGGVANDGWEQGRAGFRYDHDLNSEQHLTVQSDYYSLSSTSDFFMPNLVTPPNFTRTEIPRTHTGFNVLGRWTNRYSDTNEISIQSYIDAYHHDSTILDERRITYDIELQHHLQFGDKHDVVWGIGYRRSEDKIYPLPAIFTVPASDSQDLFSFFVQDEIRINDEFRLTLGTKIEHNDYTQIEIQPSIRASWLATETQTVWAAISRAVRTPNRAENDMRLLIRPFPQLFTLPNPGIVFGRHSQESTEVISYEAGYRNAIRENLMLDVALFYNEYDGERNYALDPTNTTLPPNVLPLIITNSDDFENYGFEFTVDYRPIDRWTIRTSYSYLHNNHNGVADENTPEQQVSISNFVQLTDSLQFDTTFRYVDDLRDFATIDDYLTMDARIAWRPSDSLEMSLNGRNLLHDEQIEFVEFIANRFPTGVERSIYAQITWEF